MKKVFMIGLILISQWLCLGQSAEKAAEKMKKASDFEYLKTRDPKTGLVPQEKLYDQIEHIATTELQQSTAKVQGVGASDKWIELGPNNAGGRVRAFVVLDEGNGKRLAFAGGTGGGLWKSDNLGTPYWQRVNDYFDNLNISCIVAHPTDPNILFFGTGEGWRNPELNGNDPYPHFSSQKGGGIWKSKDKGQNWTRIASTQGIDFNYIQRMVIDGSGYLWVGTLRGLFRSNASGEYVGNVGTQAADWTEKLGSSITTKSVADIEIAKNANGTQAAIFVSVGIGAQAGEVYRTTNNGTSWTSMSLANFDFGQGRIELATTPNKPNILFASQGSIKRHDNALTASGGGGWTSLSMPIGMGTDSWSHNVLLVDKNTSILTEVDEIVLYAGYEDIWRGIYGGINASDWTKISNNNTSTNKIHVDQHLFVFDPCAANKMYICNDGGIYRCNDISQAVPYYAAINNNLFIAQFYTCATDNQSKTYLGGTQDNSSFLFAYSGISTGINMGTGDGAYCHFDNNSNAYITADQEKAIYAHYSGAYNVITNYSTLLNGLSTGWLFINPTELDGANNILYVSAGNNEIIRISDVFNSAPTASNFQKFTFPGTTGMNGERASYLKLSPNDPSVLYIGTTGGRLLQLNNANTTTSASPPIIIKSYGGCNCYVSSIDVKKTTGGADTEVIYAHSNYNVPSLFYNSNISSGGFVGIETNVNNAFGDVPVRSVLFAPAGNSQGIKLMLGTEVGVYSTDVINGTSTVWTRFPINRGMPILRVDMLKMDNNNEVVAATFGRGLMRTDMFSTTKVDYSVSSTNLGVNCPITFTANVTGFPTSSHTYSWELWNGSQGIGTKVYGATGNSFSPACWNLGMTITLAVIRNSDNAIMSRVSRPLYYMITPGPLTCNNYFCNTYSFIESCGGASTARTMDSEISIYPNPSNTGIFNIRSSEDIKALKIYDLQGKLLKEEGNAADEIRLENYPSGIYFYQIETTKGNLLSGKLIKE